MVKTRWLASTCRGRGCWEDVIRQFIALLPRHSPMEPKIKRVLPWPAAENHEAVNAYQRFQNERAENHLLKAKHLASFIGLEAGTAPGPYTR